MDHRELILSANKKAKFAFLALPTELQDEIIDGLDGQTLTLEAARDLISARGHSLSHEGVAAYYRAVRRERRLAEGNLAVARSIEEFRERPTEELLAALINQTLATAISGIANGEVGIKDINVAGLLKSLAGGAKAAAPDGAAPPAKNGAALSAETIERIRKEIYGL